MNIRCDICDGSGYVNLHIRRTASLMATREEIPTKPEIAYKTFPCPQCQSKQAADETIQTCGVAMTIPERMSADAEILMKMDAARALADHMLRNEAIRFTKEKRGDGQLELIGVVGCVTQNQVERIEAKERRAAVKYAQRLISRFSEKLAIWGRDLDRTTVNKDDAYRFIREAATELERNKMNRKKLAIAAAEARRFLARVDALPPLPSTEEIGLPPYPSDNFPREQGAIKRASMDLTRALADLRKPDR